MPSRTGASAGLAGRYLLLGAGVLSGDPSPRRTELGIGAAGAVLISLALKERLRVHQGSVVAVDARPTGVPHLDRALRRVSASPRRRRVSTWVQALAEEAYGDVLRDLVRSRSLAVAERGRCWFPVRELYEPVDREAYKRLTEVVRHALFNCAPVSRSDAMVASLLHATGLHHVLCREIDHRQLRHWVVVEESLSAACNGSEWELTSTVSDGVRNAISARVGDLQFNG
ncbi:GOLPH3/VPS74 family protein [Streptomyces griseorubiginosus]|uniref:GOLPH3/VPS74 family protein n=1 Tax=Streptomyces griseorubiginosus TaxID=67304 RepID=UPI0036ED958C